jgi:hypothetical protein
VAEEGWAGVSDAGQPDAAGTDAEGFGGAVGFGGSGHQIVLGQGMCFRGASGRLLG